MHVNRTILRRWQVLLVALGVVVTVMMGIMVGGCYLDDHRINQHKETAIADVVSAGRFKSAVSFVAADGQVHNPRLGVLYPTHLTTGQRISVEYDSRNPDVVRVAGRGAELAWRPAISVTVTSWLVIGAVMVALAEFARRRPARPSEGPEADSATAEAPEAPEDRSGAPESGEPATDAESAGTQTGEPVTDAESTPA